MPDRLIHCLEGRLVHVGRTTNTPLVGTLTGVGSARPSRSNMRSDPVPDLVIVFDLAALFVDLDAVTIAAYPDGDLGL